MPDWFRHVSLRCWPRCNCRGEAFLSTGSLLGNSEGCPRPLQRGKPAQRMTVTLMDMSCSALQFCDPTPSVLSWFSILKPKEPWLNTPVHFDTFWPNCGMGMWNSKIQACHRWVSIFHCLFPGRWLTVTHLGPWIMPTHQK